MSALRNGRFTPPHKDPSGDYLWFPEDLERAREGLGRDRRTPSAAREQLLADAKARGVDADTLRWLAAILSGDRPGKPVAVGK
jgi:hypothetical protein